MKLRLFKGSCVKSLSWLRKAIGLQARHSRVLGIQARLFALGKYPDYQILKRFKNKSVLLSGWVGLAWWFFVSFSFYPETLFGRWKDLPSQTFLINSTTHLNASIRRKLAEINVSWLTLFPINSPIQLWDSLFEEWGKNCLWYQHLVLSLQVISG